MNVWKSFPFYMVQLMGALQVVPEELYAAAKVDGAGVFQRFRYVTVPHLRPVVVALVSIDFISSVFHYDLVRTLTEGGPFRGTQTVAYLLWRKGFVDGNFGFGSAMSVVLIAGASIVTCVYVRMVGQREEVYGETTTGI